MNPGQWRLRRCFTIAGASLGAFFAVPMHAQIVVRADVVHTMAAEPIRDGVIVMKEGKIVAVGPASAVPVPDGMRVIHAAIATPGLIDARGTLGVSGLLNQKQDQDQLERSSPIQPELRAIDAYNPNDPLVAWVRSFGVTAVHTGHAPGELISGQTMVVKTAGRTVEAALVRDGVTVAATLSPWAQKGGDRSPGTRAKMMAMLREQLIKAREYRQKHEAQAADPATGGAGKNAPKEEASRDLRLEMLARVLSGEVPLLVSANRAQDIQNVLRLADEFKIRVILDSGAEAYLLIDDLAARQVPVIIHPSMARAYGELENASVETPAKLVGAGVRVAMQSGYESYVPKTRVVLFEAAIAAANGLAFEQALALVTRDAALILGVHDRLGTLEVGKDADVALFDSDPFEFTGKCVGVIIDGILVSDTPR